MLNRCDILPAGQQDPTLGRGARLQQSLTESGIYYVQIKHHDLTYGPQTGYDLSIQASCSSDAYEPNDQCAVAPEVQPNQNNGAQRSFCGANDEDWLFWQATAGVTYQLSTEGWAAKSQPVLALYEGCGGAMLTQSGARTPLTWTATATGPLRLRVMNADPTLAGLDTGYTISVTAQLQTADPFEPNDTAAQAKPLTLGAPPAQHAFSFPGDQDWLTFTATANQPYRLETLALAAATDTYLCVYGADPTTPLACDDDSGAGLGSKLLWQAPTSGQYYLRLYHYAAEAGGAAATYQLLAQPSTARCDADPYEPDNSYGEAREITINGEGQRHTSCDGTEADWVRFTVQTPGVYEIQAAAQGADADPMVTLYDSDGQTLLFNNDDYRAGLSARMLWPFARPGVYYVRVQSFNAQADGNGTDYHLQIRPSQELPTPLPTTPTPPTPTFTSTPTPTPTATPTALPEATPTPSGPIKTLILTNQKRLTGLFGVEEAQSVAAKLQELAQDSAAPGILVDLAEHFAVTQAYDAWDNDPGNLAKANATTDAIRALVWYFLDRYPQIDYIVLVGDDRIIPHRRAAHKITVLKEAQYAAEELAADTTVGQALRQEVILFDDFYASREARKVKGQLFYLPDKAIGRLVETPQEIKQAVARYLQNQAVKRSSALLIANDLHLNRLAGAQKICEQLRRYLSPGDFCKTTANAWGTTQFSDWHLRPNPPVDLHLLDLHSKHWAVQMGDQAFLATGSAATPPTTLAGTIVMSVGSHSALSVGPDEPYPFDWPQFYAQQGALFIGNSATELFLREEALGLSHKLLATLANQFWKNQTIGGALVAAKQTYWQEAREPNLNDRHVLHQMILFGLPMYQLPPPQTLSGPNEFPSVLRNGNAPLVGGHTLGADATVTGTLTFGLAASFDTLALATTSAGNYYTLDGHVNWKADAAGQPLYFVDLDETLLGANGPARGVLWLGGVYTDVLNPNLLIPQVAVSDGAGIGQSQVAAPASVAATNPIPAQLDPTGKRLVVEWGHYDAVENRQRLYGDVALELTFSTSPDTLAPTVQQRAAQVTKSGIAIKLEAADASGIRRAVATYTGGDGLFQSMDLTYQPDMDKWVGVIPGLRRAAWFAQVVDGAGNVAYVLDKGKFFQAEATTTSVNYLYLPTVVR